MGHGRNISLSTDFFPAEHHRFEAKLLKQYIKNKSILDVGCWTGQFLSLLSGAKKVTGIDVNKEAIGYARKKRKGRYLVASALELPFEDNKFDVVTMFDVIEHLPEGSEDKALREVSRVLRKRGIFAISTVSTHPLSILLDPAFFILGHRHYSKKTLVDLIEKNNYKILKIVYTGGIWSLLSHNFSLLQKHIFKFKKIYLPFKDKVLEEYKSGFDQIHIVSQKN